MTDGQKIEAMRKAFKQLAGDQPTHNNVKTWALEGANDLPAIAMLDLWNLVYLP